MFTLTVSRSNIAYQGVTITLCLTLFWWVLGTLTPASFILHLMSLAFWYYLVCAPDTKESRMSVEALSRRQSMVNAPIYQWGCFLVATVFVNGAVGAIYVATQCKKGGVDVGFTCESIPWSIVTASLWDQYHPILRWFLD
jgi:hypothetical protein